MFILMGQSNMVGMGEVGPETTKGTLAYLTKTEKRYPHLLDDAGKWTARSDVRHVFVMHNRGNMQTVQNDWLTVKGGTIGPELQFGHIMGHVLDEPVLVLKTCIGNRSLGWDLLPPGSERFSFEGRIDWASPDVDWSQFRCAVFRTTWDYFERRHEFTAWLHHIRGQTRLCNDAALIDWNMDKHYLADLEAKGIPIVPSKFIERGSRVTLHELLDESGWHEAIIKPCISGAARHTYRVNHESATPLEPVVRQLLTDESLILQPFQQSVMRYGEDTLMLFNGCFTHAVRKVAKPGDFRVQDDHGGTVHPHEPSEAQIEFAQRAMAACQPAPAYARVDLIRDNHGNLAVMELELIEPELWLRNHPLATTAFADAIAKIVLA